MCTCVCVCVFYSLMAGVKMCLWCWWGWKFAGGLTELLMVPLGVKICSTVCLYLAHWSGSLAVCMCVLGGMGKAPKCARICMSAQSCKFCVREGFGRCVCLRWVLSHILLFPKRQSNPGQLLVSTQTNCTHQSTCAKLINLRGCVHNYLCTYKHTFLVLD